MIKQKLSAQKSQSVMGRLFGFKLTNGHTLSFSPLLIHSRYHTNETNQTNNKIQRLNFDIPIK